MTLHTYNKSQDASEARLLACLRMLVPGDSLLLLEEGVYIALQLHPGMQPEVFLPKFRRIFPLSITVVLCAFAWQMLES